MHIISQAGYGYNGKDEACVRLRQLKEALKTENHFCFLNSKEITSFK